MLVGIVLRHCYNRSPWLNTITDCIRDVLVIRCIWKDINSPCTYPGSPGRGGGWWGGYGGAAWGAEKALGHPCLRLGDSWCCGSGRTCCGGPICWWATPCWIPGPGGGCMLDNASKGVYDLQDVNDSLLLYKMGSKQILLPEKKTTNYKKL
jgi:hypothetical protein